MSRTTSFLCVAIIFALLSQIHSQSSSSWTIIDPNFETIAMANSFYADNNGYVAGGTASAEPLLLYTTDGGQTFTNANLYGDSHAAFLSIDMYDSQNGIAGALGFAKLFACGAYTHDGLNWNATHNDLLCAIQDCQAVDSKTFVMVGEWSDLKDIQGNGIVISSDGGKRWHQQNWNQGTSARYAWFDSSSVGYVVGGMWPEETSTRSFSRFLHYNAHGKLGFNRRASYATSGYVAILAKTTNGGSSFSTVLNLTDAGIYFNEISCTDLNNCWLAAEGVDKSTGRDVAYIYYTNDGWQSYEIQLTVPGGSLITIDMLNGSFGWAGGALLQSNATVSGFEGQVWLTTDGSTWTLNTDLKNFYTYYLSTTSESYAYASGLSSLGLSSFAAYSPTN